MTDEQSTPSLARQCLDETFAISTNPDVEAFALRLLARLDILISEELAKVEKADTTWYSRTLARLFADQDHLGAARALRDFIPHVVELAELQGVDEGGDASEVSA